MRLLAVARGRGERSPLDPVRHVRRGVLLEEALPLPAVRIALHRERPPVEMRDEDLGDVPVVRNEIALGDPFVGPERLVEVRQAKLTSPASHVVGSGSRSRRTSGAVMSSRRRRYDGERRRPSCVHSANSTSATSTGSTQVMSVFRTRGIFGVSANGESVRRAAGEALAGVRSRRPRTPSRRFPPSAAHLRRVPPRRGRRTLLHGDPGRACTQRRRPLASGAASACASRRSADRACTESPRAWRRRPRAPARAPRREGQARRRTAAKRALRHPCRQALEPLPALAERLVKSSRIQLEKVEENEDALPPPSCRSEKRERPRSSRAQISPSSTASDERIASAASRATSRKRSVRSLPLRLVSLTSPPETRDDRAKAVPLRLVDPTLAGGERVRGRRQHRLETTRRRAVAGVLAEEQPVLGVAVESGRHERPDTLETVAVELDREPAVPLLLEEVVGAPVPDLDGAGAVLAGRDHALEVRIVERMVLDVHREMALSARSGTPLGTAQLARAPSRSSRKS